MAVAQIFQKRGFKYDDQSFSDMSDKELLDFLESCAGAGLGEYPDLKSELEEEIGRDERKNKQKLMEALHKALEKRNEPHKAVPREVKEDELKTIVDAFGKKYGFPQEKTTKWKKELTGLLNKIVRAPKFDNRILSGCSWCGRPTPRLVQPDIRRLAYFTTIKNIRVRKSEFSAYATEEPSEDALKPLRELWPPETDSNQPSSGYRPPTKGKIEKLLKSIGAFEYQNGKIKYPMSTQLFNILSPSRSKKGRARLCTVHLKMASEGKTMKDAGFDWQTRRELNFRNPARKQHQERVIKEIEKMLFLPRTKGNGAWRFGPVNYVTLEVPEPDTKRSKKGEQPERHENTFRERLLSETGGVCIYTGKPVDVKSMHVDHIIPKSKNGPDVRDNRVCASETANKDKGDKLPSEWLKRNEWDEFKERVERLSKEGKISEMKKDILLLSPESDYPDNKTPLARISGSHRTFVRMLREVFEKYGVPAPQIDYTVGKPVIQEIDGRLVQKLRRDWAYCDVEGKIMNFPEKDRTDLANHAQDAAIAASVPPHTWRDKIFVQLAKRKSGEKGEIRERTIARLDLAPDWSVFERKPNRYPLLKIFSVSPRWKTQLLDQTLYIGPSTKDGPLYVHKPVEEKDAKKLKPGQRHQKAESQKGGAVIIIPGIENKRPARKVQVKPYQSTGCKIWLNSKGKVEIALVRPLALKKFFDGEPAPPEGSILLKRDQIIPLPPTTKTGKSGTKNYPAGHYYIKEISKGGIEVIHERCANPKGNERKLGKTELKSIFFRNQE